jgi:predicted  nucleic acid-binding Zn-ribbon protein
MQMRSLVHLYEVDLQVRGLRQRLASARRHLDAQEAQLAGLTQQSAELLARQKHLRATTATLEVELAGHDERIEKLRDQLNSAVTNKQYNALLLELNTIKSARTEVENRILDEMATVEQMTRGMQDLEAQIAERTKVRDVAAAQLRERQAEVGERLAELEAEREQAAASVPAEQLQVFEAVAALHDGEALAPIEEIDRRDREYACGECHMTLPFENVAVLATGGKALVRCTACGRILYMQEETRGALR